MAVGFAAGVGAVVGGALYDAGGATPIGSMMLPFLVATAACVLVLPLVYVGLPADVIDSGGAGSDNTPEQQQCVWTLQRVGTLASVVFWAAAFEGLLPVLGPALALPPTSLNPSQCGMLIGVHAFVYMMFSLPVGWWSTGLVSSYGIRA